MAVKFFCDGCDKEVKAPPFNPEKEPGVNAPFPLNSVRILVQTPIDGGRSVKSLEPVIMHLCDRCTEYFINHELPTKRSHIAEAPKTVRDTKN
jgi:hypothetical protein